MDSNMASLDDFPSIENVFKYFPIQVYYFLDNHCGFTDTNHYLILHWVYPMFINEKATASKYENTNWWQLMSGQFTDESWKVA